MKAKYSSRATDKAFVEGKNETDDNTTDDDRNITRRRYSEQK